MNKVLQLDRIIASEVWTRGRAGSQSSDSELQQTQFTLFCLWIASIKEGIPESEREPARERERERENRKLWDALCLPVTGRAKCRDA